MDAVIEPVDPWSISWADSSTVLEVTSGTVLKHPVVDGTGNKQGGVPVHGCVCDVDVTGWVQDSKEIFLTTYESLQGRLVGGTGEPLQVHLGFDTAGLPPCTGALLQGMQVGEACVLWMEGAAAYGAAGDGGKVPPHADIVLWLHLRGFSLPQPPALPPAAQEAAKQAQHTKDREAFMANPPASWDSRLRSAAEERAAGNALFRAGQWEDAAKAYGRGMVHLFLTAQEAEFAPVPHDTMCRIHEAKAVLLLNRSAAHKAAGRWDAAEWDANESMKHALQAAGAMHSAPTAMQPADIPAVCLKALFRRAQCRLGRAAEAFHRRPCLHLGACERGAQQAAADFEASQKARSVQVALAPAEQGVVHVVPPAAGHDRVSVGSRVRSPPPVSQAACSGIQRASELLQACRERRKQDKATALEAYGGSLLRQHAAAAAEAISEPHTQCDQIPELGD